MAPSRVAAAAARGPALAARVSNGLRSASGCSKSVTRIALAELGGFADTALRAPSPRRVSAVTSNGGHSGKVTHARLELHLTAASGVNCVNHPHVPGDRNRRHAGAL